MMFGLNQKGMKTMQKLKLKFVRITFEHGIVKQYGGYESVDHIETSMTLNSEIFKMKIFYETLDNQISHCEVFEFDTKEIVSIDQRWL